MLTFGVTVTVPDLSKVDMDFVLGSLHEHAEEIADLILKEIEARTPVDTGALQEDETYELLSGGGQQQPLVTWYVGSDYQEAEWNREYSVYQEGPPLGLSTYTNGPHQMFARVATDDLPLIQTWADWVVGEALDQCVAAANDATTPEIP